MSEEEIDIKSRVQVITSKLTTQITELFYTRWPTGATIHTKIIRDKVELAFTYIGLHKAAYAYILYQKKHCKQHEKQKISGIKDIIHVVLENGVAVPLDQNWLTRLVCSACSGLEDVDAAKIIREIKNNLFDGVSLKDVYKGLVMIARTLIESEPNYTYVTARLLLHDLYYEVLNGLHINVSCDLMHKKIANYYVEAFKSFIYHGIQTEHLHPNLQKFDLDYLAQALKPERDQQFTYLSLQTLYDRYLIHHQYVRIELPQVFSCVLPWD